ncbi:alanine--tRNA ligase [Candidatus Woesearchaeota archaeon]|nr:alanine--tRNA ligase [Candidatus Woesearchaeota archaeon]
MIPDKQVKKEFKQEANKNPDQYYATAVLKQEGFMRKQCACGMFFWSVNAEQKTCGDPGCSGGFRFINGSPAKNKYDYIQLWKKCDELFSKWGYTPIKRYPVTARWRDDTDFVQASIYNFQPYVVSGEVKPPANPLVVPQFCLRFNDIDNVGITGAHYTGFVMIGQHAFMPPEQWNQQKYFADIYQWLRQGLGLPQSEITFHEDAWAGGGNFGPCMEFFSRGLELGNQVYMLYEQTPSGNKPLKLKVLDMGMGHERNAWFTQGTSTSYETTFPTVCKSLFSKTGIRVNPNIMKKFLPYASYLNADEVESMDKAWDDVAKKVGMPSAELRSTIQPLAALFSVAEHSRSLLVALNDGALPSNVGGGYNLRVLLRRALEFIDHYGWDIDLNEVCEQHAAYLKPLFPELSENLENVKKILSVEKAKWLATQQKSRAIVAKLVNETMSEEKLLQLYDAQGIAPELVKEEAKKVGKEVHVPDNFYAKVAELHATTVTAKEKQEQLDLSLIPETKARYYENYQTTAFQAKVLKIIGCNVILDETYFYPTSGGQLHDVGTMDGQDVIDVVKQGKHIIQVLKDPPRFAAGAIVAGVINKERRIQLAQHHTATHIINAAAKKVLGAHINQAGARKAVDKASLDITHYQSLTEEEIKAIEHEANRMVKHNLPVISHFLSRDEAEKKYGMRIYQGGAVPGNVLRIVEIPQTDVECCGGTHLHSTQEIGTIRIIKAAKISDAIVRIEFKAGKAALEEEQKATGMLDELARVLNCKPSQVPARAQELFDLWKTIVKKGKAVASTELTSTKEEQGEIIAITALLLKTQPEHVLTTVNRFWKEIREKLK